MRYFVLLTTLITAACNGPSPRLIGTPGQEVQVGGATFIVYIKDDQAEAVRTNFEFPANVRSVFPRALEAMEQVPGCTALRETATGDAALIKADLDCG